MPKDLENSLENQESQTTEDSVKEAPKQADESADTDKKDDSQIDSDSVVEKLKHRLGKEQADKVDAQKELADLREKYNALKEQKSVKKLSEEDKTKKALSEKDKRINELEFELKHREALSQVDAVFKEAGLNVGEQVLNMVTSNDDEKTYNNAQAVIELVNKVRKDTRNSFFKGKTPTDAGKHINPSKKLSEMSLLERVQLKKQDPEAYRELEKGAGLK